MEEWTTNNYKMGPEERRFNADKVEMREDNETISGIASKVGNYYDLGYYEEKIEPGAFDDVLNDDVRVLFNHEPGLLLGRTKNKTARHLPLGRQF